MDRWIDGRVGGCLARLLSRVDANSPPPLTDARTHTHKHNSYDMIVQYASHQTLFIQALHEHIARNGLRIRILDYTLFAGGQVVSE
jgi:hypothetical protein